ncbi:exodeoxyribonuclease III [Henriciella aquimarina]|uniref:exodeoxyribonuclease III n=1 Tax=Henriciella aquimarina TaxID=545261 RepID=UPI000A0196D0|nr:exodeoxyribonuclease III [Henriciella aquimarina]
MSKSPFKIATWNINSVRLRAPNIEAFLAQESPDVLCLQEIKCQTAEFPAKVFNEAGYEHHQVLGQSGGHHGVALVSRHPIEPLEAMPLCREGHARVQASRIEGFEIHNIYLPAGGDVPDPEVNEKFAHKLDFLACMARDYAAADRDPKPRILVGDLNVAPHENDVWSHKQLLKIVSHTPAETEALEKARKEGGFTDIARELHDDDQKLYTWWSYRAKDWAASNRGRRLDHIWANDAAMGLVDLPRYKIHLGWRGGWKPSDHAPVTAVFDRA